MKKSKLIIFSSIYFCMMFLEGCNSNNFNSDNSTSIITSDNKKTYLEVINLDNNKSVYKKKIGGTDEFFSSDVISNNNENFQIISNAYNDEKNIYKITNESVEKVGVIDKKISDFEVTNNTMYCINYTEDKTSLISYDMDNFQQTSTGYDLEGYIVDMAVSDMNKAYVLAIENQNTYLYTLAKGEKKKELIFNDTQLGSLYVSGQNIYIIINESLKGDINSDKNLLRTGKKEIYIKGTEESNVNSFIKTENSPMRMLINNNNMYVLTGLNGNSSLEIYDLSTKEIKNNIKLDESNVYGMKSINGSNYIIGSNNIIKIKSDEIEKIYELNNSNLLNINIK